MTATPKTKVETPMKDKRKTAAWKQMKKAFALMKKGTMMAF